MINNLTNKCSCWTLDFGRTASMKSLLPSVRQSVRLSDRPSVSKFSQDWIISFIWYCAWWYLTIVLSSDWRSQIFEKKKKFFFYDPNLGPGPKWDFSSFSWVWIRIISFPWNWIQLQLATMTNIDKRLNPMKKIFGPKFGPDEQKSGRKLDFLLFCQVWFISYPWNFIQWSPATSRRDKINKNFFEGPN